MKKACKLFCRLSLYGRLALAYLKSTLQMSYWKGLIAYLLFDRACNAFLP